MPHVLKDMLRTLLHTVLLTRALGPVRPRECSSASFPNVYYCRCGDSSVDKTVEEALERFCAALGLTPQLLAVPAPRSVVRFPGRSSLSL